MLGEKGSACYYCGDDTYIYKLVISRDRIVITYRCERCKAAKKKVLERGCDVKKQIYDGASHLPQKQGRRINWL